MKKSPFYGIYLDNINIIQLKSPLQHEIPLNKDTLHKSIYQSLELQQAIHKDFSKALALEHMLDKNNYTNSQKEALFTIIGADRDEYDISWIDLSYYDYYNLKKAYAQLPLFNAISFLQECSDCSLSRKRNPNLRLIIETALINTLMRSYPDKKSTLVITDLASGGLFQLFIILSKLIAQGYSRFIVNIIDIEYAALYKKYIQEYARESARKSINLSCQPNKRKTLLEPYKDHLSSSEYLYINQEIKRALKYYNNKSKPYYLTEKFTSLINLFIFNNILWQFTRWFKSISAISIDIVLYKNAHEYLKDVLNNQAQPSSLLYSIDYLIDLYPDLYATWNTLSQKTLNSLGSGYSISKAAADSQEVIYLSIYHQLLLEHYTWDPKINKFIDSL